MIQARRPSLRTHGQNQAIDVPSIDHQLDFGRPGGDSAFSFFGPFLCQMFSDQSWGQIRLVNFCGRTKAWTRAPKILAIAENASSTAENFEKLLPWVRLRRYPNAASSSESMASATSGSDRPNACSFPHPVRRY